MDARYVFRTNGRWTTRRNGVVQTDFPAPTLEFSAPQEFQGEPGLWTPEHFLLAAVAACFITTFGAIAELSKFAAESLEVTVEGWVEKADNGLRFTRIALKPRLGVVSENEMGRAIRLLEKAERSCLITRSLRSEVQMEPQVEILTAARSPAA